ncbi:MAG: putative oxidoreductase [Gammaproteobacteria bacterium]|jgi:predicted oxidoreductase
MSAIPKSKIWQYKSMLEKTINTLGVSANTAYKADVVIAGAGILGIVAALVLLESDLKLILPERDEPHQIGGLAKEAFGAMFFVDSLQQRWTGIKDSAELALSDWFANAEFAEEDVWPKNWAGFYVNNCTQLGYRGLRKQGPVFFPL